MSKELLITVDMSLPGNLSECSICGKDILPNEELQEPCEYCNPAFINPFIDDDCLYLFIDKDRLFAGYSDECTFEKCESVKINYCPMCGREMEV